MAERTDGPWMVVLYTDEAFIEAGDPDAPATDWERVAYVENGPHMEANARFIAAAPDTFGSLAECLPILESMIIRDASEAGDDMSQEETAMLERAHAALARAEGVDPDRRD